MATAVSCNHNITPQTYTICGTSLLTKGIKRDGVEVQESGIGETVGEAGVSGPAYDKSSLEAEAKGSSGPALSWRPRALG